MLRPLNPDGSPKRDRQLSENERRVLNKHSQNGRNLRTERGRPDRREK